MRVRTEKSRSPGSSNCKEVSESIFCCMNIEPSMDRHPRKLIVVPELAEFPSPEDHPDVEPHSFYSSPIEKYRFSLAKSFCSPSAPIRRSWFQLVATYFLLSSPIQKLCFSIFAVY